MGVQRLAITIPSEMLLGYSQPPPSNQPEIPLSPLAFRHLVLSSRISCMINISLGVLLDVKILTLGFNRLWTESLPSLTIKDALNPSESTVTIKT